MEVLTSLEFLFCEQFLDFSAGAKTKFWVLLVIKWFLGLRETPFLSVHH